MKINYLIFGLLALIIFSIPSFYISAQEGVIPGWLKNMAVWWGEGKIADQDFINALQYLVENNVIIIEPE